MELSISAAALEYPRRIALVSDDEELSYEAVAASARRIQGWLLARGVTPGSRVALVAAHRRETALVLYALFELGVCAVLIHPRLTAVERAALVTDSSPQLVLDETFVVPDDAGLSPPASTSPVPCDDRPLAILYTSGSTGAPKGAILSRAAFVASARGSERNLRWQDDDRWLLAGPTGHIGGLSVLTRCLIARTCVVLTRGPKFSSVDVVCDAIERHRATLISLPPPFLDMMLSREPAWRFPAHVRAILLGSMAPSPTLLEHARRAGAPVVVTYGCTEACSQVATQELGTAPSPEQGCGPPLEGTEVRIEGGEIQLRGPTLMTDYFPPGRYARPFTDDGWFKSGDLGHFDEAGRLHVSGRKTDRLITGGENVDPLEVERVLDGAPGVVGSLVFGVPDERFGQCIAAALVASPPPADEALATYLSTRLADFKRPRFLVYVDKLPATSEGKPDRKGAAKTLASSVRRFVSR